LVAERLWYNSIERDVLTEEKVRPRADTAADLRAFYRNRRVMVTGGMGFIGSNLARRLVNWARTCRPPTR